MNINYGNRRRDSGWGNCWDARGRKAQGASRVRRVGRDACRRIIREGVGE